MNMKKILMMMAAVLALALAACGNKAAKNQSAETEGSADSVKNSKVLVAYFSASGVTAGVAKQLAEVTGGELHQIQPEQPYTDADLDWRDKQSRSTLEMQDKTSRPAIINKLDSISQYDVIYVGFPIWWGTAPTIVNTFMESYDFSGKTVVLFATSGGSGIEQANKDFAEAYPNVNWKEGKLLNSPSRQDLEEWVKGL